MIFLWHRENWRESNQNIGWRTTHTVELGGVELFIIVGGGAHLTRQTSMSVPVGLTDVWMSIGWEHTDREKNTRAVPHDGIQNAHRIKL